MKLLSNYVGGGQNLANSISVFLPTLGLFLFLIIGGDESRAISLAMALASGVTLVAVNFLNRQKAGSHISPFLVTLIILFSLLVFIRTMTVFHWTLLDPPHLVWCLVGQPSSVSVDRSQTIFSLIFLMNIGAVFLIGVTLARSKILTKMCFNIFLFLIFALCIWSFFSFELSPDTVLFFWPKELFTERLTGPFLSPNTAGTFFGMSFIFGLADFLRKSDYGSLSGRRVGKIDRLATRLAFPTLLMLLTVTDLLLTASRAAILATFLGASTLVLLRLKQVGVKNYRRMLPMIMLVAVGLALALTLSGGIFFKRMGDVAVDSISRQEIYSSHWAGVGKFWWLGFGGGTFSEVHKNVLNEGNYPGVWNAQAMHNVYLQWLEASGVFGAAPALLILILLIVNLLMGKGCGEYYLMRNVTLSMGMILLSHGIFDFALENLEIASWWALMIGMCVRSVVETDLPLNFHPVRTKASGLVTPIGAG